MMKNILFKITSLITMACLICGVAIPSFTVMAYDADSVDYYVNLTELTYAANGSDSENIPEYTLDDFAAFVSDYNSGSLPDIYITAFLFDGIDQVKKISKDDNTGAVTATVVETTALNINTTGNIEFSGIAMDTMIAVDTNGVTRNINLILNEVNLTSTSSTPAIMVYNKDVKYSGCKVTIKTVENTYNYITGGKLKKVSTMTADKVDSYTNVSSIYSDTANAYYYVYSSSEISHLLYAQETADREKVSEGDPYTYYKFSGAIGTDIALNFEGEGYLEIASLGDEGIETKGDLNFIGGKGDYKITSYDDGLNTSTSGDDIYIDVNTMIVSVNSDASEGDAIDSNGTIHIEGGTIFAFSHPASQDNGLDSDNGTYINGGTVIATGNMADSVSGNSEQEFINLVFKNQQSAGTLIGITETDGTPVMVFQSDRTFTNLIYSSPDLEETTYYVYKGGTVTGTEINGLYTTIDSYEQGTQQQWSGSGNELVEFTFSSSSHTFYNMTDYTPVASDNDDSDSSEEGNNLSDDSSSDNDTSENDANDNSSDDSSDLSDDSTSDSDWGNDADDNSSDDINTSSTFTSPPTGDSGIALFLILGELFLTGLCLCIFLVRYRIKIN